MIMQNVIAFVLGIVMTFLTIAAFRRDDKIMGLNKNMLGVIFLTVAFGAFLAAGTVGAVYKMAQPGAITPAWMAGLSVGDVGTGNQNQPANQANQGINQDQSVPPSLTCDKRLCADTDTVTLAALDAYLSTASGGSHRYSVNGAPAKVVSDAGTFTAAPCDYVDVTFFNASTSGAYYSDFKRFQLGCTGAETLDTKLYGNGSITLNVYNEEGDQLINGTINETVTNGDTPTLKAELKGQYQKGMPYGGIIACDYNTSLVDDIVVDFGGIKTGVPNVHTTKAAYQSKAYTLPPVLSNALVPGTIYLDIDDTNDPTINQDVDCYIYPSNYFINEKNGAKTEGPSVEDEDDAVTYANKIRTTIPLD